MGNGREGGEDGPTCSSGSSRPRWGLAASLSGASQRSGRKKTAQCCASQARSASPSPSASCSGKKLTAVLGERRCRATRLADLVLDDVLHKVLPPHALSALAPPRPAPRRGADLALARGEVEQPGGVLVSRHHRVPTQVGRLVERAASRACQKERRGAGCGRGRVW